jgi:hypothetical protein
MVKIDSLSETSTQNRTELHEIKSEIEENSTIESVYLVPDKHSRKISEEKISLSCLFNSSEKIF